MAACKSVVVVCPNARRQTIKVGPTTTILQILEDVCKKQGVSSQEHGIKHQRKILDETLPIRYSGLSNNAHLELVKHTKASQQGVQCTIALQLPTSERLQKDFPPEISLWDLISHWNSQEGSEHQNKLFGEEEQDVVCVYMTQRISGEKNLKKTTLHSLGLTGKRAIIRLLHEKASVETTEPTINDEPKLENTQPTTPVTIPSPTPEVTCKPLSSGDKEIADLDRHRPLDMGTVSPDRGARDPKRTRVTGPTPLFPDFKFPESPANQNQSEISITEERLQQLATPCERCPVIFSEDDQSLSKAADDQDLPDSFYDVTVEDLRKMLQGLHSERTKGNEIPLLTKAMRESRRLQEVYRYEKVVIRVKFPDRLTLQGFFRPQEKVSVLTEYVKSHLEDPDTVFYLYTTPPKTVLKNQEATLFDSQLCPASLVYFGSSAKQDHFLSTSLIGNLTSALDAEKSVFEAGIRGSAAATSAPAEPKPAHTQHPSDVTANGTNGRPVGDVTSSTQQAAQPTQAAGGSNAKVPKWFKGTGK